MNIQDVIAVKRDGEMLSKEQIDFFIKGVTSGDVADYQASALLMAMYINKLTKEEAFFMTDAMKDSGDVMDLSSIEGVKADKHSTGGVGDKTTLVVAPLVAACGIAVAKMSGRGLGFTGGTVDKLEAIPGFRTEITPEELVRQARDIGLVVAGQSGQMAPADKKIYALRDVTGTVANTGLIAASVMSKKLAAGADVIVLDVKCGAGAFMEEEAAATELGEWLVAIGRSAGKTVAALITEMGQPLGHAVGNANEVIEAIETLKGRGPKDVTELSLRLAAYMIYLSGKTTTPEAAYEMAAEKLKSGGALEKLRQLITAQGGDPDVTEDYALLPVPAHRIQVLADRSGFVQRIHAGEIGRASGLAGAGRIKKEDIPDISAGITIFRKIGEYVESGELLAEIYGNDRQKLADAAQVTEHAFVIGREAVKEPKLVKKIVQ